MVENVEVFWHDEEEADEGSCWIDQDGGRAPSGFYYWSCIPGCMPEGDPYGPFSTYDEAWFDAEERWGDDNDAEEREE